MKTFGNFPQTKKLLEVLLSEKYSEKSKCLVEDYSDISYRYNLVEKDISPITTISGNLSFRPTIEKAYPTIDEESFLIIQNALLFHESGNIETQYFQNSFNNKDNSHYLENGVNSEIQSEDIFVDAGGMYESSCNLKVRASSLERSITPDIEEFIDNIYNFKDGFVGSEFNEVKYYDQDNLINRKTCVFSLEPKELPSEDSDFLRRDPISSSNDGFILPKFENYTSSYAECYLEVDGMPLYETCHDEIEVDRKTKYEIHPNQETNKFRHKLRKKNKSTNQEWRSIQKIIEKSDFRPLDAFNEISYNNTQN